MIEPVVAGLTLFGANLLFIGLKAVQQRNVQYLKYIPTFLTSQGLAIVEIFVIYTVADRGLGWDTVLPIGLGGGLGACLAMYLTRGYKNASER